MATNIGQGKLVFGAGEAPFDLADTCPPSHFASASSGDEVVADVGQPCPLGLIGSKK